MRYPFKNEQPTPTETGTVTVTCKDESETPLENAEVMLATVEQVTDPQTQVICGGFTDENGTVTLKEFDWESEPPLTDITANVLYGTYYLVGASGSSLRYSGTLTVDGNEEVTITLTGQ